MRVFVDAKITGTHDRSVKRRAHVGYFIEESALHDETEVDVYESDEAETRAVLFAIEKLADKADHITIICDHQSVVSEAKRETVRRKPSKLLEQLRKELKTRNLKIQLEAIQYNKAHASLSEYVKNQLASPS